MQPQNVGGYLAYWNANQGRMTDYQTGAPLADRLAAVQSTQPHRGDMIYGDSYGGVQAAESGQQQAFFNQAMAQEQMRQQALARQDALRFRDQQANQDRNMRIAALLEDARQSNQRNLTERDKLMRNVKLDAARGNEFNIEQANKLKLESMKQAEKDADLLDELKSGGIELSSGLSMAFNDLEDSKAELAAFQELQKQWMPKIATAQADQKIVKTDAGYVARNGGDSVLADMANQIADQASSAKEAAARIRQSKNDIGALLTQARSSGFDITPDMKAVVHPQAGKFQIQLPVPVSRASDKPKTKDQPLMRPAASGIGRLGGRYISPNSGQ
jgi:hypothetical protein